MDQTIQCIEVSSSHAAGYVSGMVFAKDIDLVKRNTFAGPALFAEVSQVLSKYALDIEALHSD